MNYSPAQNEDRLDVFASVQFDPEVWELVQKKYHHFADLHGQLEDLQKQRRDLLAQLATVNDSISTLQNQLVSLSGKDAVEAMAEDEPDEDEEVTSVSVDMADTETPKQPVDEAEAEPVVGLAPLDMETEDKIDDDQAIEAASAAEPSAPEAEAATLSPAVGPEPAIAEPIVPEDQSSAVTADSTTPANEPSTMSFAQPIKEETEPVKPATEASAPIEMPSEVHELQSLFDAADEQRRQADSALKLVQLYDGKADMFFSAMCRSHQQSGLSEAEARQEATKDVQTMIATAKSHAASNADTKKSQNGGMRRLFSH